MKRSETFQTRAMREIEKLKNMRLYQEALLKIVFPDRKTVVQARFSPQETEADIRRVLMERVLSTAWKSCPFQLYTAPPKAFLREGVPLSEQGLVPAAQVYLSWQETREGSAIATGIPRMDRNGTISYPTSATVAAAAATEAAPTTSNRRRKKTTKGAGPSWLKL